MKRRILAAGAGPRGLLLDDALERPGGDPVLDTGDAVVVAEQVVHRAPGVHQRAHAARQHVDRRTRSVRLAAWANTGKLWTQNLPFPARLLGAARAAVFSSCAISAGPRAHMSQRRLWFWFERDRVLWSSRSHGPARGRMVRPGASAQRNSTMNATRGSCATLHEIRGRVHLWSMWSIAQWRLLPHWLDHYARLGVVPAQTRILLDTHDGALGETSVEDALLRMRRVHRSSKIQCSQRFFQLAARLTLTVLFSLPTYLFSRIQIPVARSRSGLRMKKSDSLEEPLLPRSSLLSAPEGFFSCPQSGSKSHRNECTNLEENN